MSGLDELTPEMFAMLHTPILPLTPKAKENFIASVIMLSLSVLVVVMRFGVRISLRQKILGADYTCLLSLVLFGGYGGVMIHAVYSVGIFRAFEPAPVLYPHELEDIMKATFTLEMMFGFVITAVKLSILWFYHDIFGVNRTTARVIYAATAICIVWVIIVTFLVIFQCNPPEELWKSFGMGKSCMNISRLLFGYELSNFFLDFMILCIPITVIKSLKLPMIKKISAITIFVLGAFVCVTSLIRLTKIWDPRYPDKPMQFPDAMLWSSIQLGSAIVCSCLPTFGPLLSGASRQFSRISDWYGSKYGSRSGRQTGSCSADVGANMSNPTAWILLKDKEPSTESTVSANAHYEHGSRHQKTPPAGAIRVNREVDIV